MPFDASGLWWPPLGRAYNLLSSAKADAGGGRSGAAEALQAGLKEYEGWLALGVAGFRPPSDKSKVALESEGALAIGDKKMPVDPALRAAALKLSRALVRRCGWWGVAWRGAYDTCTWQQNLVQLAQQACAACLPSCTARQRGVCWGAGPAMLAKRRCATMSARLQQLWPRGDNSWRTSISSHAPP